MFKPTNPKMDLFVDKLKEVRSKKHDIDNEISEMPFIYSDIEDLAKEIKEIDKKISSLTNNKMKKSKELSDLKNKIAGKDITELRKTSSLLEKDIRDKEAEIQKLIDNDFRTFIDSMTKENTMEYYLFSDTSTTPIMDKFYNDKDKDFLVFKGVWYHRNLVITKSYRNITVADVPAPTMTELKTFRPSRIPDRMRPLWNTMKQYDDSKLKIGQKVQFDIPLPLGGQTYANQTGYGWEWEWSGGIGSCIEGTFYGEVTTFLIIGFIRS